MSEKEIIEGKKSIAKFMGHPSDMEGRYKTAPYHTSWDWLMPVVEKIRNLGYPVDIKINGGTNDVSIYIGVGVKPIGIYESDIKANLLQCTFESVLEFINWYNTQPK